LFLQSFYSKTVPLFYHSCFGDEKKKKKSIPNETSLINLEVTMVKKTNNATSTLTGNKRNESLVFTKRKPAFKVRIDSLRARSSALAIPKPQKAVRIAEHRNTVLFRHVLESELEKSWYRSKDYSDFESANRTTLDAFNRAQGQLTMLDNEEYCIRGLEAHVSDAIRKLRQSRIISNKQVVLDQQKVQRFHGVQDPLMLASVSQIFSKQSRQQALSMGALDEVMRRS